MTASITWRNNSWVTCRLLAATLSRPGGGKAPLGRGRGGPLLSLGHSPGRCGLGNLRAIALSQGKIAVGEHDQGNMPVKSCPQTALVVIQAKLAFGVLVEALNHPAEMGQLDEFFKRLTVQPPGEVILGVTSVPGARPLTHQPTGTRQGLAPLAAPEDAQASELLHQGAFWCLLSRRRFATPSRPAPSPGRRPPRLGCVP